MRIYLLRLLITVYFLIFQSVLPDNRGLFARNKIAKIDLLRGSCPGHENAPLKIKNIRIIRQHGMYSIFGKLVVTYDNFTQFQVRVKSKRCNSKEVLDSCEDMPPLVVNKLCNIFRYKNQPWSPFIESINPTLGCPVKKGVYFISNGTIDAKPLLELPLADMWYWKSQSELYEENTNTPIMCIMMDGEIIGL